MLKENEKYTIETTGIKMVTCKNKKQAPFLIIVGNIEGMISEYLVSVYRIISDKPFDAKKPIVCEISRRNENIFFDIK